ncbi:hypothetical protein AALO_G00265050 [Alosa alosa]|uniref:Uncharacterized protein n=1 Tax=Alosa alosa TaxID=278164 RepID=A0AAV6FKR0_9TELE|nr:hypothetical protein AALO_G00265050 [Alosa alosa]
MLLYTNWPVGGRRQFSVNISRTVGPRRSTFFLYVGLKGACQPIPLPLISCIAPPS